MGEISKDDLHDAIINLKGYIDDKFNSHEQIEKAMLEPIIQRLGKHGRLLTGPDGDTGLVKDVNNIKNSGWWIKTLATIGAGSGLGKWLQDLIK